MRLGQRVIEIVRRFDITPPNAPSLVPIGGVQTSPMKLAQAYAALENGGMLPQIRFLRAAIGPRGNIVGLPVRKDGPRVMSSATASSVLQALRGPVKRGTARGANSAHALVYGKTGTSSRNEDALFVGLTQDFVGSIWLGHDRPAPMPGVHGGGTPAKSFSKLTDFYYVRLAQDALRGKRGDGGRRFALGQTEDFRGKAAWDHRHDRAWLAGGVVLLATGLVPPERAAAESAARRAAA